MYKKTWLAVLCAALCSRGLCAQQMPSGMAAQSPAETLHLGIEEMFGIAEESSLTIRMAATGTEAATEAIKAAKSQRGPDISVSASGSLLGNGILWDRNFGNAAKIEIPRWGNNFALEATQVIYAGGAVDAGVKIAGIEKEMADLNLQMNRQEIFFLLAGKYLDLYRLDNQITVLENNLFLTEQVISEMIVRREEGTVLKNDITRYELQREELKLQIAKATDARINVIYNWYKMKYITNTL